MHAVELTGPALSHLTRVERPDPGEPRRGEVLVRMRAASLNFLDVAVATGMAPGLPYPLIPLCDGAGEIVAIGSDVQDVAIGDRVIVHPKALWLDGPGIAATTDPMRGVNLPGSAIEIATVDAATVVRIPDHLSWEGAATLPIAATTAWRGVEAGGLSPGATVLLIGTGGVSLFALQFAKARGARVIMLSSQDEKLERARALGADEGINYKEHPDWAPLVQDLTGGVGVDLVIETAGAATFDKSLSTVRQNGTVFTIGFLGGAAAEIDLLKVISRAVRIQGSTTGSVAHLARAAAAIAAHGIEPVIAGTFGVDRLDAAYAAAAQGAFGKIAVTLDW